MRRAVVVVVGGGGQVRNREQTFVGRVCQRTQEKKKKRDQQKCLGANTQRLPRREVCTHAQRRVGERALTYGLD